MGAKDVSKTMVLKDGVTPTLKKISKGTVEYKRDLRDLRNVGIKTWTSMRDGMRSVAKEAAGIAATIAGISGAAATISTGISAASELENYRLTLETVMKDTKKAGELMRWASQFANITPFDTDEVVEGTVRLQAYGISAVKTMRQIGDMAAVMNKPLMQAIEAIADAQTGELERLKEFGITKSMIEAQAKKMGMSPINSKGQITDTKAFNEALFALMEERFAGGMERQAKTFSGVMSNITGTWRTGLAEIMGATAEGEVRAGSLFAMLKSGAESAAQAVERMAADGTFQRWGDNLASIISGTKAVVQTIVEVWPHISPVVYGVVGALVAYKLAVYGAKAANVVKTNSLKALAWWTTFYGNAAQSADGKVRILTLIQHGFNAAMRANPIGTVITLLGLLVVAGTYVVKNWEQIKLAGMKTWNVIVDAAQLGVNKLVDFANFMLRAFKYGWEYIEYMGKSIWNGIIKAGENGINGFIGLVEKLIQKVFDGINKLIRQVNKIANSKIAKKLGIGPLNELTFSGLGRVNFSGAKAQATKPIWDDSYSPISHVDFSGAKFSDDAILAQTQKAQKKVQQQQEKKEQTEKDLIEALMQNTEALTQNTSATGENTSATKENTVKLIGNRSAVDIADTLLSRIERHLWAT